MKILKRGKVRFPMQATRQVTEMGPSFLLVGSDGFVGRVKGLSSRFGVLDVACMPALDSGDTFLNFVAHVCCDSLPCQVVGFVILFILSCFV